jgi:beta-xylosidase
MTPSSLTNLDNWMNSKVLAKTASAPEGPWSEPITLYQATPISAESSIYAAIPHPYYDLSGKTLVITFTNHPNVVQAIKVVSCLLNHADPVSR